MIYFMFKGDSCFDQHWQFGCRPCAVGYWNLLLGWVWCHFFNVTSSKRLGIEMVVSSLKSLFHVVSTKPPGSFQQSWYPVWQSLLVLVLCPEAQDTTFFLVEFHEIPLCPPLKSAWSDIPAPGLVCRPPWGVPPPPPGSQKGLNQDGSQGKPLRDPVVFHILLRMVPYRSSSVPPQAGSISRSLCLLTELILAGLQQLPAFWCLTNVWFRDGFYL